MGAPLVVLESLVCESSLPPWPLRCAAAQLCCSVGVGGIGGGWWVRQSPLPPSPSSTLTSSTPLLIPCDCWTCFGLGTWSGALVWGHGLVLGLGTWSGALVWGHGLVLGLGTWSGALVWGLGLVLGLGTWSGALVWGLGCPIDIVYKWQPSHYINLLTYSLYLQFGGSDILHVYQKQQIKHRFNTAGLYIANTKVTDHMSGRVKHTMAYLFALSLCTRTHHHLAWRVHC